MTLRPFLLALAFTAAMGLAGCGKTGALEQPPPLYGAKAKADYEAKKTAQAAAKASEAEAARENEQNNTVFDQNAGPPPEAPFAPPIPGRTDPLGPAPQAPGMASSPTPDQ